MSQNNLKIDFASTEFDESLDFRTLFHPILLQHYQCTYFNINYDLQIVKEQVARLYFSLNEANLLLGKKVKAIIDSIQCNDEITHEQMDNLRNILLLWQKDYNKGNVFRTYSYLKELTGSFLDYGIDLKKQILKEDAVISAFKNSSFAMKSAVQFRVFVLRSERNKLIEQIVSSFISDPVLFTYVREFCLFKVPYKSNVVSDEVSQIKIVLNHNIVTSKKNPIIGAILRLLLLHMREMTEIEGVSVDYSLSVGKNIFLAQGDNGYKKFLQYFGVLGDVYTPHSEHAYFNI